MTKPKGLIGGFDATACSASSRLSDRLIERLKREGWISKTAKVKFRRLYPGYWQRASGGWTWTVEGHGVDIGSQYTARECVDAVVLTHDYHGGIVPEEK